MRVHFYPLRSAMHGAVNISTRRWGYICFKPPTYVFGRWWPWYFYLSPNATPWGATLILGRKHTTRAERRMARLRRILWGHGYSTEEHNPQRAESYMRSFEKELPHESAAWIFDGLRALNRLRNAEGASVTIFCDNQDATHIHEQAAIEVTDSWTDWEPRRFTATDWMLAVLEADKAAYAAAQETAGETK